MLMSGATNYIGVKSLNSTSFMKQDLLIFDQLAIVDLEKRLSNISDRSKVADIEWLFNKGLIFDLNSTKAFHTMFERNDPMYQLMLLSALLLVLSVMMEAPDSSNYYIKRNKDIFSKIGVYGYFDYSVRVLSSYVETNNKVRAVPLLMNIPERETWDVLGNLEKVYDFLHSLPADIASTCNKELLEIALNSAEKIKERKFNNEAMGNLKDSYVVDVVLQNIPIADEDVSWEQILDFRNDENSKIHIINLRRWINKLSSENPSIKHIQEEIDYLISSYHDHMRFHKMKTQLGIIETIVSVPLDIAEQLVKLKWSNIAKSLFFFRKKKLALMEAERSAPGRELAYIIKAKEQFRVAH